jgi:3-oxoacyl-[acyl-carrier-protein] synthase-3
VGLSRRAGLSIDRLPLKTYRASGRRSAVAGIGSYVPDRVMTNQDLERMVNTSDQWIRERTGIRERRVAAEGTPSVELAAGAAKKALEAAGVSADQLDLIMVASSSPDAPFPSMACRLQERLGAQGSWAFDLLAACTGLVYELAIADSFVASGRADNVLVVGAEVLSRLLDYSDRTTCVLLGDAAAAVLIRPVKAGNGGFLSWCLGSDGRAWDLLTYGETAEVGAYASREARPFFRMKGRETFRVATEVFVRESCAAIESAGLSVSDIDLFVPHQANLRIMEAAAKRIGIPREKVMVNIDRYGNTSTATIPLALDEALAQGRLHPGDNVLLASFGSGLTWGACVTQWV